MHQSRTCVDLALFPALPYIAEVVTENQPGELRPCADQRTTPKFLDSVAYQHQDL
jgi:hypothetical protein